MEKDNSFLIKALGAISIVAFIFLYITGELTTGNLVAVGGVFVAVMIVAGLQKTQILDQAREQISGPNESRTQESAMTYDQAFDWVNEEFLENDKREGREIQDDIKNTRSQQLTIESSDGTDFVYRAIAAPYSGVSEALYIVIECLTRSVIDYDNVKKTSQVEDDMFKRCPEVKRLRKKNNQSGLTTGQLRNKTQNMAVGGLNGVYGVNAVHPQNTNQDTGSDEDEDDDEDE